jgi:hypothetical protein
VHDTITRLAEAMNRHDPEGMAAVLATDYRSEQPMHPNRGFGGSAQVVENWTAIFGAVPDMVADLVTEVNDGKTSFSEWHWHGHRPDGSPYAIRGVILNGLRDDGLIQWARLYAEPVEEGGANIVEATRAMVAGSD